MVVGVRVPRKQQPGELLDARFRETLGSRSRPPLPPADLAEVLFAGCRARQCFGEEALGACCGEEEEQGAPHFDATRRRRDAVLECCSMQAVRGPAMQALHAGSMRQHGSCVKRRAVPKPT